MSNRPSIPAEIARKILIESGHRCAVCGTPCPLERAHIISWHKSKEHKAEDLICLCANCHQMADHQGWGEKTLREYKRRPWVMRPYKNMDSRPGLTSKVTIELELEHLDEKNQRWLQYAIAAFLEISPNTVRIASIERGSMKVIIELPTQSAERLLSAYKRNDYSELVKYLAPLALLDLRRKEVEREQMHFLDVHCRTVIKAITDGRLIPFLGAGVNLCSRSPETEWRHGQPDYLLSGGELAAYLSENFGYPSSETQVICPSCESEVRLAEKTQDLARVSQYVAVMMGTGPLYEELHSLFDADYPPTSVHQFLATLPAALRDKGYPRTADPLRRQLVIVTTNYDDLLERAFQAAGEPFHLVSYVAEGEQRGKFLHWPPDGRLPAGEARLIEMPNQYRDLLLDQQLPVILKIHGAVDRVNAERDSFVITEDHYIDYLTRTDIASLIPVPLPAKLKKSHLLFLGYSLRDWNLRVILHRIWGEQKLTWKSWAIQLNPDPIDVEFWRKRDVDILDMGLEEYIAALSERVQTLPRAGGAL